MLTVNSSNALLAPAPKSWCFRWSSWPVILLPQHFGTVTSLCKDTQCKDIDARTAQVVTSHCILTAVGPPSKEILILGHHFWEPNQSSQTEVTVIAHSVQGAGFACFGLKLLILCSNMCTDSCYILRGPGIPAGKVQVCMHEFHICKGQKETL